MRSRRPGEVRDAIVSFLDSRPEGASVQQVEEGVRDIVGRIGSSSVRSYLRLNANSLFECTKRGQYKLARGIQHHDSANEQSTSRNFPVASFGKAKIVKADCLMCLKVQDRNAYHGVVTDPPYGLFEYSEEQQSKLRIGKGGVWRIPPSFDGVRRSPLPRFTVLTRQDMQELYGFFHEWATVLLPVIVPGANVVVASNPLLSYLVAHSMVSAGFERRGEIVRMVMTMRGGDRPKAAHDEFPEVSVMPRSMWEPWLVFRKPLEGRVQDNLRKWKTGGFRRPSQQKPFGDVIPSSPTHKAERLLAPHPSLKPQSFLRKLVRGVLPLGEGIILDPFAGSGATLAAANYVGYSSIGTELDPLYYDIALAAIPKLTAYRNGTDEEGNL